MCLCFGVIVKKSLRTSIKTRLQRKHSTESQPTTHYENTVRTTEHECAPHIRIRVNKQTNKQTKQNKANNTKQNKTKYSKTRTKQNETKQNKTKKTEQKQTQHSHKNKHKRNTALKQCFSVVWESSFKTKQHNTKQTKHSTKTMFFFCLGKFF